VFESWGTPSQAGAQAYNWSLGAEPQQGPGAEPLVRRVKGRSLLKLKYVSFWTFNESGKFAHFSEIWKRRILLSSRQRSHRTVASYFYTPLSHVGSGDEVSQKLKPFCELIRKFCDVPVSKIVHIFSAKGAMAASWPLKYATRLKLK